MAFSTPHRRTHTCNGPHVSHNACGSHACISHACGSHVVGSVVLPGDVVVEAVGNVVKLALWEAAHKALGHHLVGQGVLFITQLTKGVDNQTYNTINT